MPAPPQAKAVSPIETPTDPVVEPKPEPEPEPLKGPFGEGYLLVLDTNDEVRCTGMDGTVNPDDRERRYLVGWMPSWHDGDTERFVEVGQRYGPRMFEYNTFPSVTFKLAVDGDTVTLWEPSGTSGNFSECSMSMPLAELPWFADPGDCAVAVRTRQTPMHFGDCAKFFPGPDHDLGPTKFDRRFRRGGTMWERTPDGCEEWTFSGRKSNRSVTHRYTADGIQRIDVYRVFRDYHGFHRQGPQHYTVEDGKRKKGAYVRCEEISRVLSRDHDDHIKVDESRWYYEREACEASPAPRDPADGC